MPRSLRAFLIFSLVAVLFVISALQLARDDDAASSPSSSAPPQRIISMAPNLTEILFAIGAGPQVVAVSSFTTHPPEAMQLPALGGLHEPSLESLLALSPDLVVTKGAHPKLSGKTREVGLRLVELPPCDDLDEIREAITALGRLTGHVDAAAELRARIDATLAELPRLERPSRVLLIVYRDAGAIKGLYAAGSGTYLSELLEATGARNALEGETSGWLPLSLEAVLEARPEVIIELDPDGRTRGESTLALWRDVLPSLPAVASGRVHVLSGAHLVIPGPRIIETARALAARLQEAP